MARGSWGPVLLWQRSGVIFQEKWFSMKPTYCYNILTGTYSQDGDVKTEPFCNGYTVRNIGDTLVIVSGMAILPALVPGTPGESVAVGGNLGEIFIGRLTVRFAAPIGANPLVEITQKYYIDPTF